MPQWTSVSVVLNVDPLTIPYFLATVAVQAYEKSTIVTASWILLTILPKAFHSSYRVKVRQLIEKDAPVTMLYTLITPHSILEAHVSSSQLPNATCIKKQITNTKKLRRRIYVLASSRRETCLIYQTIWYRRVKTSERVQSHNKYFWHTLFQVNCIGCLQIWAWKIRWVRNYQNELYPH